MKPHVDIPAGEKILPEGFEDLEHLAGYWAVQGADNRRYQRSDTSFEQIRQFYDAMLPRSDEAMTYLDTFPLRDMPGPETRLKRMILSLAQASMAIEIHRGARVANSPWPNEMRIITPEEL